MKDRLFDFLACPSCGGEKLELESEVRKGNEILEGSINCPGCGRGYPIVRGIPRMLPEASNYFGGKEGERTPEEQREAEELRLTIKNYSSYQGKVYAPLADRLDNRGILEARTGMPMEEFKDKVCLDAGCGVGRFCRTMGEAGAELVIGFDAGFAVDEARERSGDFDNIEWVQADILRPPFRKESIDRAISMGVLNLTVRPDEGFRRLSRLVAREGSFSIYMHLNEYVPWNKIHSIRTSLSHLYDVSFKEPFRKLVSRMPDDARLVVCKGLWQFRLLIEWCRKKGAAGRFMAGALERLGPAHSRKMLESGQSNVARNYDGYSTPYQHTNEMSEIIDWYERTRRYDRIRIAPYRLSVTGWVGGERSDADSMEVTYYAAKPIDAVEAVGVGSGSEEQEEETPSPMAASEN